jgi:hypothetical protein
MVRRSIPRRRRVIVDTGLNAGGQKEILFGVAAAR